MGYTREERHDIYRRAIELAERSPDCTRSGICRVFMELDPCIDTWMLEHFPELLSQKPFLARMLKRPYWWKKGRWAPRRRALAEAMEATKPEKHDPLDA